MKINELITRFEAKGVEVVFQEMISGETGLVKWANRWFCFVNTTTGNPEEGMLKALVMLDHSAEYPPEKFAADENTAQFLERIKGPPESLVDDPGPMLAAQAKLLEGK
jgi:hypothetical protein